MGLLTTRWDPGEVYGILARNKAQQAQEQAQAASTAMQLIEHFAKQKQFREKQEFDREMTLRREGMQQERLGLERERLKMSQQLAGDRNKLATARMDALTAGQRPYVPDDIGSDLPSTMGAPGEPSAPVDTPASREVLDVMAMSGPAASSRDIITGEQKPVAEAGPLSLAQTVPAPVESGESLSLTPQPIDPFKEEPNTTPMPAAEEVLGSESLFPAQTRTGNPDAKPSEWLRDVKKGVAGLPRNVAEKAIAQAVVNRAREESKPAGSEEKPILRSLGGTVQKYNPETGRMETISDPLPAKEKAGAEINPRLEANALLNEQDQWSRQADKTEKELGKLKKPQWPWKEGGKLYAPDTAKPNATGGFERREVDQSEYDRLVEQANTVQSERLRKQADIDDLRTRAMTAKERLDALRSAAPGPAAGQPPAVAAVGKKPKYEYRDGKLVLVQ